MVPLGENRSLVGLTEKLNLIIQFIRKSGSSCFKKLTKNDGFCVIELWAHLLDRASIDIYSIEMLSYASLVICSNHFFFG